MKKSKTVYICQTCGFKSPKWLGKCSECGSWNSFTEEIEEKKGGSVKHSAEAAKLSKLDEIQETKLNRIKTDFDEFDQVLGGGVVKGGVILIGGEPGIGKSTIILQIASNIAKQGKKIFYFSGEESLSQLKMRAERLKIESSNIYFSATNSFELIKETVINEKPDIIIIDSIQTIYSSELQSAAGTVSQIKFVTHQLVEIAKQNGISTFIIGQITKEGAIAGPKILEHLVDTVLYFEGDYERGLRILRAVKNRFGSTNEIGIFEMSQHGLMEYSEKILAEQTDSNATGKAFTVVMEGTRAFIVEVQALVSHTYFNYPRRNVTGFDLNRLNMLLAILEKKCGIQLSSCDVYLNIAGGLKITETTPDLSVCAAIISSFQEKLIPPKSIFLGEVGLTGEIRTPYAIETRVKEAKKLGFKNIIANADLKGITKIEKISDLLNLI